MKTDFVQTDACFYILHSGKKYGYDLVGEGLEREMRNEITGRGTA